MRRVGLSSVFVLVIAVVCVVAFIVSGQHNYYGQSLTSLPEPALSDAADGETSEVFVALQPMPRGAEFTAGSIGRRVWSKGNIPPDAIASEAEVVGKVAKTEIVQGQVIVRNTLADFSDAGEAFFMLPEDIPADDEGAVSYTAQVRERRVIIYIGHIWLVVEDTQAAVVAVAQLAEEKGGYVSETNTFQTGNNVLQGDVTIRVPATLYQETLAALRALALRVDREESRSEDVTEEFIDHEARLANLRAGEEAIQRLLDGEQGTAAITEIAEVQQKLAQTRSQIEQTEGRLRYLTDQAALSTIRVELISDAAAPTPLPGWNPQSAAGEASQSLVFSLQRTVDLLIWGVLFALPLLVVYVIPAAVGVWLLRWGWRRFRRGGKYNNGSED